MRISKKNDVLFFTKDNGDSISVSLVDGTMNEKVKGLWIERKSVARFFKGCDIVDISNWEYEEDSRYIEHLINLILRTKYRHAKYIGTALKYLYEFAYEEELLRQGFYIQDKLSVKLNTTKQVIEVFKNSITLTDLKVKAFNTKAFQDMVEYIPSDKNYLMMLLCCFEYNFFIFKDEESVRGFLKKYNLNLKQFSEYLYYIKTYEGYHSIIEIVDNLECYYTMNLEMDKEFEKYPKFLRSKYEIATACYNIFKQNYNEDKFKDAYKKNDYSYKGKIYSVIKPINIIDVKEEYNDLGNCIPNFIDNACQIYFMRKNRCIVDRLITIKVTNKIITEASGVENRRPLKHEMAFIKEWANKFGLEISKFF